MKKLFKILLKPFLGKQAFQGFFEFLRFLALKGMNFGFALVGNSGEINILKSLKDRRGPLVIFDVGANVGDYTQSALQILGEGTLIYAFEPNSENFRQLEKKFGQKSNVKLKQFALGERAGEAEMFLSKEDVGQHSMYKRKVNNLSEEFEGGEKVSLEALDEFCQKEGVAKIHLLKLDVEGHELAVLKGAKVMLEQGIERVQFEFGGANIDSKTYLRDFFEVLSPQFNIYRVLQNGVRLLKKYEEIDEVFFTVNYLAVRKGISV